MRKLENDLLIKAAYGQKTHRPPVWMMRQAGRILPEYLEVRGKLDGFKALVENPEKAAEVTLQPVDILGVDAAIIFSDILVIPEAMGLPYQMIEKRGPYFESTIQTASDVKKVHIADPYTDLKYVLDAISLVRKSLGNRLPLIGFAGAPWTIFSYMIEGSGSKTFSNARKFLIQNEVAAHELLEKITLSTIYYLKAQIESGTDLVQVFDSWAGILSPDLYQKFAIPYLKMICDAIDEVPITLFSKGAFFALQDLSKLDCQTIGLDWHTDPIWARKMVGENKTLQGNFDPTLLYASDEIIVAETIKMLHKFGNDRHIANLGHGVYPDTDFRKAKLFIDTVKNYNYE